MREEGEERVLIGNNDNGMVWFQRGNIMYDLHRCPKREGRMNTKTRQIKKKGGENEY